MDAEAEATGLIKPSHPEEADGQAAWLAIGDRGAAVAQDSDLLGARPSVPDQPAAMAEPPDPDQEAASANEERLGLARELHDTIASAIAVIAVQAAVADQALERCEAEPQRAREALRTIRAVSLQALDELQATVTTLRGKVRPSGPRPGVARLEALTGLAAAAGVRVELAVVGTARPLPTAVDLAVYRIVQEALTNVLRHAGSATATVRLTYREGDLTVQVDDDGRGAGGRRPSGGGNGLLGMGERVATLAGGWRPGHAPAVASACLPRCPWTIRRKAIRTRRAAAPPCAWPASRRRRRAWGLVDCRAAPPGHGRRAAWTPERVGGHSRLDIVPRHSWLLGDQRGRGLRVWAHDPKFVSLSARLAPISRSARARISALLGDESSRAVSKYGS